MRHLRIGVRVALVVAGVMLAGTALAQGGGQGNGGHGHGYQGGGHLYFDPDTIATYSGVITGAATDWQVWGHGNHTGGGMDMAFRADSGEEFDLMLGPVWFLQDNGIVLSQGEPVTVTASRVEPYDGGRHHGNGPGSGGGMGGNNSDHDYLVVTVLEADGVRLVLRDGEGYPVWRGGDGWNDSWFDPDTVTTLTGTLVESQGLWSAGGFGNHTGNGMHYVFEDGATAYYAMLGPWWYLQSQGLRLQEGQTATITGSVVEPYWNSYAEYPYLIATAITVGGVTVQLRDEWGYPLWHGTGWHYYSPAWSSATVGVISGEVRRIRHRRNGRQLDKGYELTVRADGRTYRMFVAPDWDVRNTGMTLRRGQQITARGSIVGDGRSREMVVEYVDANGARWRFRNRRGTPLWVQGNR